MAANFNNSAWFYDRLSRLVYGKALVNAQVYLLRFIPAGSSVLIVGGGTGWILQKLAKIHPSGLAITYVEIAPAMMALSKKKDTGQNHVTFINDAIENVRLETKFDVVATPFLFDNFTAETTRKVFNHIYPSLKPGGLWLNADFQLSGKWWQKVMLQSMFWFFQTVCNIEGRHLPDVGALFKANNLNIQTQKTFYGDFILSQVWKQN